MIMAGLALCMHAEIQFEEKKVQKAIKEAALRGDMGSAKVSLPAGKDSAMA